MSWLAGTVNALDAPQPSTLDLRPITIQHATQRASSLRPAHLLSSPSISGSAQVPLCSYRHRRHRVRPRRLCGLHPARVQDRRLAVLRDNLAMPSRQSQAVILRDADCSRWPARRRRHEADSFEQTRESESLCDTPALPALLRACSK